MTEHPVATRDTAGATHGPPTTRSTRRNRRHTLRRAAGALLAATALAGGLAACGGDDDAAEQGSQTGEIVITCTVCVDSPSDPFLQYHHDAVERFNRKYKGRYQVKAIAHPSQDGGELLQYYQRLALADDLPDIFQLTGAYTRELAGNAELLNFADALNDDPAWKDSFYPGAFDALSGDNGEIWAIPEERDAIGIFYNKKILADAGVASFPQTWDEFEAACAKVKQAGKTCFAMDGGWVTLLMWSNLIGTQPGGKDFLTGPIADGHYASNPLLVKATETLKRWHTDGYVNRDAFSGDFTDASTPYLTGEAAMVANGPWMVSTDIKGKDAEKGLYEQTAYEAAPGWTADQRGTIVVAGEGGWVSGATDPRKQEAVIAFMKFLTSPDEAFEQTRTVGAYPAVKTKFDDAQTAKLEPLAASLVKTAETLPLTYPHVYFNGPPNLHAAWENLWPAYAKGEMDTNEFLTKLGEDATSKTS